MARRGAPKHMKRLAASRAFGLLRKSATFVQRALPGKHKATASMPISYVLKYLGLAKTMKEAKQMLHSRNVKVDGAVVVEVKYPVGLMDVVTVGDKNWRILYDSKGRVITTETKNPKSKVCKVEKKFRSKGGEIQMSLHDGRTVKGKECKVGDSFELELPSGKVTKHYPLKVGSKGMIVGGKHVSKFATIEEIHPGTAARPAEAECDTDEGKMKTLLKYLFPLDQSKL